MTWQSRRALLGKELRELLPLWAVSMAGLVIAGVSGVMSESPATFQTVRAPAILFFTPAAILGTLAPIALGAMAMGHEYRHRTVTTLLALPVGRGGLLATKAVALGVLLLALAGAAWWVGARTPWLLLPLALGFCLAPWFTLLTRSELGGMVFACAVPALLLLVGELAADEAYGSYFEPRGAAYLLRTNVVAIGTAALCVIAAADTVRRFLALQVIDGFQSLVASPAVGGARAVTVQRRPTNVYVALVKKELRLQTLPIVVASAFGLGWWLIQLSSSGGGDTNVIVRSGEVLLPLFALLLAILTGAVASADERHLGVWAAQTLLPVPMWRQWVVKVAVVLGLAFTFALVFVDWQATRWRFGVGTSFSISLPLFAAGAAALSLYVSSISNRGVTALLVSAGAATCWLTVTAVLAGISGRWVFGTAWQAFREVIEPGAITNQTAQAASMVASRLLLLLPIVVLVWLGLRNHRRLDHPMSVLRVQIAAIVVATIVSVVGLPVALAFDSAVFDRNSRHRASQGPIVKGRQWALAVARDAAVAGREAKRADRDEILRVLRAFEESGLDYVLMGSTAMAFHGVASATEDLQVLIRPTAENVERLRVALRVSYAGDPYIDEISEADLLGEYPAVRYYPPSGDLRFDILTHLGGAMSFESIQAETKDIEGTSVRVATPATLYRMKKGAVRAKDNQDAAALRERFNLTREED